MDGLTEDDGSHVRDDTGIVGILMWEVFGEDPVVRSGDTPGDGTDGLRRGGSGNPDLYGGWLDREVV